MSDNDTFCLESPDAGTGMWYKAVMSAIIILMIMFADQSYAFQSNDLLSQYRHMNSSSAIQYIDVEEQKENSYLVSLDVKEMRLADILESLTRQMKVGLSYDSEANLNHPVSIKADNVAFFEVLNQLIEGTGLEYLVSPNKNTLVIRSEKKEVEEWQETVTGRVVDAQTGEVLPGVNIVVEGTIIGTSTDLAGAYTINISDEETVLVFSYLGYRTQQISLEGRTIINVEMESDVQLMDDIVVTGYSTQARGDITGSIAIVDIDAMRAIPTGSAEQALQGHASGVNVINTGSPGERSNVFIRGISNFGDTQPLVLIDGVEANLNDIHPNDIESMQVLKDAGAASIYGVRGANGVIVITTRKGQAGAPTFSYDSYVGVQLPLAGNPFDILSPDDQMRLQLQADPNDALFSNGMPDFLYTGPGGGGVGFAGDPAVNPSNYHFDPTNAANNYIIQEVNKEGTNWFQEVFNRAPMISQNLSISGGTDNATYLLGLGHLHQQGTLLNTHLKRYSIRLNTAFNLNSSFRIGQNLNVFYKDNPLFSSNTGQFATLAGLYQLYPIIPMYDIGGNYGGTRAGVGLGSIHNPYAQRDRAENTKANSWNAVGNVYAEISFLDNFSARTSLGGTLETTHQYNFNYTPYERAEGFTNLNGFSESSSYGTRLIWTNTLGYTNLIGQNNITLLVGSEAITNSGRNLSGSRQEYFSDASNYTTLSTGTANIANASDAYEDAIFSLFGDLKYAFDNKYLFGATIRRDGSSRFGEESRYGIFPSFSLGWRISNESFMSEFNWIDDLRVRGSYGVLGSQNNVDPVNQFDLYGGGFGNAYYPISGGPGLAQGFFNQRIGNPATSWERNEISNIGFDLSIFSQINISMEYYRKSIDGLLFPQPLPATVGGATAPTVNIGDIRNSGVDISTKYFGNISSDFQYSVGLNLTSYKNIVVDVPDPGYFNGASHQNIGTMVRNLEGQPVSAFFGYKVVGIFQSDIDVTSSPTQTDAAPGRFKYRDVNGDGQITPDDRTILGDPNPDFTYGINFEVFYKNFDLSTNLYGSQGGDIVNTVRVYTDFFGVYPGAKGNRLLDAWSPTNPDSMVPVIENSSSFSTSNTMNSYFLEDGSYFRMRSLIIGYSLPDLFLQQIGITRFRVYVQARNLFTITNYSGLDPEIGGSSSSFGIDYGTYPANEKAFTFGINLSF